MGGDHLRRRSCSAAGRSAADVDELADVERGRRGRGPWLGTVDASGARGAAVPASLQRDRAGNVERLVSVSKARAVDAEVDLLPAIDFGGSP